MHAHTSPPVRAAYSEPDLPQIVMHFSVVSELGSKLVAVDGAGARS